MSLDNARTIDAIGIDNESGFAVLTIADSWGWADPQAHLLALQTKINSYFEFIECGQISESYPVADGRQLVIDVVSRFPPPPFALDLFQKSSEAASQLNVLVRQRTILDTELE